MKPRLEGGPHFDADRGQFDKLAGPNEQRNPV